MKESVGKIQKLEDLNAWKEAIKLLRIIYSLIKKLPEEENYNLKKHLMQCARNSPSNIAEGFGRYYAHDSIQFYRIAIGSLNEIKSYIYICQTLRYFTDTDVRKAILQADKCIALTYGLIRSAKKNKELSRKT
jgi:four helix bundle protein